MWLKGMWRLCPKAPVSILSTFFLSQKMAQAFWWNSRAGISNDSGGFIHGWRERDSPEGQNCTGAAGVALRWGGWILFQKKMRYMCTSSAWSMFRKIRESLTWRDHWQDAWMFESYYVQGKDVECGPSLQLPGLTHRKPWSRLTRGFRDDFS